MVNCASFIATIAHVLLTLPRQQNNLPQANCVNAGEELVSRIIKHDHWINISWYKGYIWGKFIEI